MLSSPAAAPFLERIEGWVAKLASMQDIFDAWMVAQSKWMYLGPVYGSEEIAKQMPKERCVRVSVHVRVRGGERGEGSLNGLVAVLLPRGGGLLHTYVWRCADRLTDAWPACMHASMHGSPCRYEFQAADMRYKAIMRGVQGTPEVLAATAANGLLDDLQVPDACMHACLLALLACLLACGASADVMMLHMPDARTRGVPRARPGMCEGSWPCMQLPLPAAARPAGLQHFVQRH